MLKRGDIIQVEGQKGNLIVFSVAKEKLYVARYYADHIGTDMFYVDLSSVSNVIYDNKDGDSIKAIMNIGK